MTDQKDLITKENWNTVIIGGGQAGLASGYFLKGMSEDFVILDAQERPGDSWRGRWDSLHTFTPAWLNGLPGMEFPGPRAAFPSKDQVADFLASYKTTYQLPVVYHSKVTGLNKTATGFEIKIKDKTLYANNIIVATGSYAIPKTPVIAKKLSPEINQLHSSAYKSPLLLPEGDTLVVGAGTSGLQIAMDLLSQERKVYFAGKPPFRIPDFVFKYFEKQFVWFATNILNSGTPIGRKAGYSLRTKGKAAPLINISAEQVEKSGAIHLPRLQNVREGWPVTDDDKRIRAKNIIWATGFLPDYSWINIPGILDNNGYPLAKRGVSTSQTGLFFVGSLFQYGLTSTWIAGVGRDAEFISLKIKNKNNGK